MCIFQVHHYIKPDQIEACKAAILENTRQTEHFLKWKDVYLQTQERTGNGDEFNALFPDESAWGKS